jgi:hypothetical protein
MPKLMEKEKRSSGNAIPSSLSAAASCYAVEGAPFDEGGGNHLRNACRPKALDRRGIDSVFEESCEGPIMIIPYTAVCLLKGGYENEGGAKSGEGGAVGGRTRQFDHPHQVRPQQTRPSS